MLMESIWINTYLCKFLSGTASPEINFTYDDLNTTALMIESSF